MLKESIWTWIYELQKKRGNSMLLGLDGVEIGLIIVFVTLFAAILSGFPVAFAIGGAGATNASRPAGSSATSRSGTRTATRAWASTRSSPRPSRSHRSRSRRCPASGAPPPPHMPPQPRIISQASLVASRTQRARGAARSRRRTARCVRK